MQNLPFFNIFSGDLSLDALIIGFFKICLVNSNSSRWNTLKGVCQRLKGEVTSSAVKQEDE